MTRTVPPQLTEVPGNFITSALWNTQINNGLYSFTFTPPKFKGLATSASSVPNNTSTVIPLTSAAIDTDGGWSSTTNPSRYTVQVAGAYLCIASAAWAIATANIAVSVAIRQNGAVAQVAQSISSTAGTWRDQVISVLQCNVGDYIELAMFQNSGSAQTPPTSSSYDQPALMCLWIGE